MSTNMLMKTITNHKTKIMSLSKITPNRLEDIYPLTIVATRYNNLFVILNCDQHFKIVGQIQETEKPTHDLVEWMEDYNHSKTDYGFGMTIAEAFEDYKQRLQNQ